MTVEGTERCVACDQRVRLEELVEATAVRTGEVFFVHKPGIDGRCFNRAVGSVNLHKIRQAVR